MSCNMKKSPIVFATAFVVLVLISSGFALADEHGKGNEMKNENGAQVTFEGNTKTVENKNSIKINIKEDEKENNGKNDEDNDDHKNGHGKDVDDDDDNVTPSPTPNITITPTITPTENPTITPTETPTITPEVTPAQAQGKVSVNAKIRGTFTIEEFKAIIEDFVNSIKNLFQAN